MSPRVPMLLDELAGSRFAFQHRIAFTAVQYFARLNCFVTKYAAGTPPPSMGMETAEDPADSERSAFAAAEFHTIASAGIYAAA